MHYNLHSLMKKIFDNDKSYNLQELLGMEKKYKYIIIDEENDVRDFGR